MGVEEASRNGAARGIPIRNRDMHSPEAGRMENCRLSYESRYGLRGRCLMSRWFVLDKK